MKKPKPIRNVLIFIMRRSLTLVLMMVWLFPVAYSAELRVHEETEGRSGIILGSAGSYPLILNRCLECCLTRMVLKRFNKWPNRAIFCSI